MGGIWGGKCLFRLSLYMNASEWNGKGLPGADTSERLLGEDGNYIKITCVQYTCTLIYNGKLDSFLLSLISINVFAKLDDNKSQRKWVNLHSVWGNSCPRHANKRRSYLCALFFIIFIGIHIFKTWCGRNYYAYIVCLMRSLTWLNVFYSS